MYGLGIAGKLGARDVLRGILAVSDGFPPSMPLSFTPQLTIIRISIKVWGLQASRP